MPTPFSLTQDKSAGLLSIKALYGVSQTFIGITTQLSVSICLHPLLSPPSQRELLKDLPAQETLFQSAS